MDVHEPRVRRRGFFLHSDTTGEADLGELDNPEGVVVRVRMARAELHGHVGIRGGSGSRGSGRSSENEDDQTELPQIRSGSVTGSRQRVHSPR